ncbi:MAG: hypothetical protein J5625_06570 [Lachnospiraceae bacterium]|nr:hypothetical protein [Lachnospiraceae bacterium]
MNNKIFNFIMVMFITLSSVGILLFMFFLSIDKAVSDISSDIVKNIPEKEDFVYTDEKALKYVNDLYGEAELINSVYVTEPEPKRTCTFRDVKHGFEYTLTSYKGFTDFFYPHNVTALDSDYNDKLTVDLEENIKPLLEKEGIVLFYDEDPEEYVENRITAYSYRQDTIVTPYSLLDDNKRIIEAAVCNYDYNLLNHSHNVRFFQEDLSDTEENEDTAEEIEDTEDTISYPTVVEDLGIDPTEPGGVCAPIED